MPLACTAGGRKRYDPVRLHPERFLATAKANRHTIAYARVSRHDKKDVLEIITGSALGYTGVSSTP
ncbi:hypothetical protein MFUM_720022 [Methylacidiphilum fumariolicum SolV]|uniref:Resolvase/invertase-type recombinase catalytic domain-containing protein n=2 Tax=Candidatus Methylacidiphilum fumarolicum TaxID=591154 RepID=I0JZI8_METFB|nr:conserved protein of unknown function [Candidatus Methylacidiphilum fumarolicum]CCG92657.1 hypothetical protein MFUM_720022 [Methylacidiphilum fumariolicum SolV]